MEMALKQKQHWVVVVVVLVLTKKCLSFTHVQQISFWGQHTHTYIPISIFVLTKFVVGCRLVDDGQQFHLHLEFWGLFR